MWTTWLLGIGLRVFLTWGPRWSGVSSTICNDKFRWHGVAGLGDGRGMMDARKAVASCCIMAASTTPSKVNVLTPLKDGFAEDRVTTSTMCALVRAEGLLDRLCSLLVNGWLGEAFGFFR
jgi:hypothetical protein